MTLNRTNTVLACLLVLVTLMTFATRIDYTQPNIEILPDMKYTPAWSAYSSNPVFPNGRTLQAPVAGTIARGQMPLHFAPTKEDAIRAGEELFNPYQVDPPEEGGNEATEDEATEFAAKLQDSVRRGGETFRVFCTCCHGGTGAGDGPVTKRGFPPPPSLSTGKSRQMKDGQLFHVLTYGQATMPDFRGQLSSDRRWDLVNFIRSLQSNAPEDATKAPEDVPAPTDEIEPQIN
ncbi:c-type cytochrome [Planctomycetota bacterium]